MTESFDNESGCEGWHLPPYVAGSGTSRAGAEAVAPFSTQQAWRIWQTIRDSGDAGFMDKEVHARHPEMIDSSARRARIELGHRGLVEQKGERIAPDSGLGNDVFVVPESKRGLTEEEFLAEWRRGADYRLRAVERIVEQLGSLAITAEQAERIIKATREAAERKWIEDEQNDE